MTTHLGLPRCHLVDACCPVVISKRAPLSLSHPPRLNSELHPQCLESGLIPLKFRPLVEEPSLLFCGIKSKCLHLNTLQFLVISSFAFRIEYDVYREVILLLCLNLRASLVAQMVKKKKKNLPVMQETWVWSLGGEDPLEKGMATHSSILAWRMPWIEEPGWPKVCRVAKSQTRLGN